MRVEVNRLHLDGQRRAQRRRERVLALAALLLHGALLVAVPGFALTIPAQQQLAIELAPPQVELPESPEPELPPATTKAPGGGVELPGPTKVNQPLNRQTPGTPAAGPRRQNVRPAAASPTQSTGKGHSPSAPKGNVPQKPTGESSPPKNLSTDATEVGRGQAITSKGNSADRAIADEVKPAPSKSAGVGLKPGAQGQANTSTPGKARPGNGNGTGDSAGDGLDTKPSPNKGSAAGPPVKAQPQDGGQGGASARPGKDGGNGPGGGPGKGEGPGGNGDNTAVVKPPPVEVNHDPDLMAGWVAEAKKKVRMLARTPEIAKEKGHNGKVSFSFVVGKRGRLISVSVNGGPGFSELEEECREATRTASFKPFPPGVKAEQWTVNMSLSFPIQ
jgi:TonB family protein